MQVGKVLEGSGTYHTEYMRLYSRFLWGFEALDDVASAAQLRCMSTFTSLTAAVSYGTYLLSPMIFQVVNPKTL